MSTRSRHELHDDTHELEQIMYDSLNPFPSGIGRRQLLQTMGAGALSLAAFGGSSALGQEKTLEKWTATQSAGCPSLLKFSRTVKRGLVRIHECHCRCAHDRTIQQNYSFSGRLAINKECDETGGIIPDGALMTGYGVLTVRPVECGSSIVLVGHAKADFGIYKLGEPPQLIFSGRLLGTVGVEPHADGDKRCCALNHSEGMLEATKLHEPEKPTCTLYASYQGQYTALLKKGADPCKERTVPRTAKLDGVISCPCPKKN